MYMKNLIVSLIILIVLLSLSTTPLIAVADNGDYIKIESENVGFYLLEQSVMVLKFYLPEDTYVLYQSNFFEYYIVKYNHIEGAIKKAEVSSTIFNNISNPYSDTEITLNSPKYIYSDITSSPSELSLGDKLIYIGQINYEGILWYAVKKNQVTDNIYYVKHSDVYVPAPPPTPDPEPTPSPNEPSNNLIKILLIIGIIIPAVIIVLLLFKPKKRRPRNRRYVEDEPRYKRYEDDYYYDDNDDYY